MQARSIVLLCAIQGSPMLLWLYLGLLDVLLHEFWTFIKFFGKSSAIYSSAIVILYLLHSYQCIVIKIAIIESSFSNCSTCS